MWLCHSESIASDEKQLRWPFMKRRSCFLTILVCFIASFASADAAFAQFADANWKRWDWSILYPGDEASSAVARIFSHSGSAEQCSVGLTTADTISLSAEEFAPSVFSGLGKCHVGSFANQFSRATRWLHLHLIDLSLELRLSWEAWLTEVKYQAELICCAKVAFLAAQTQREAREYWSYYEDRNHWLRGSQVSDLQRQPDWDSSDVTMFINQARRVEVVLASLSTLPSKQTSAIGLKVSRLLDWSTVQLLELHEQCVQRAGWLHGCWEKVTQNCRLFSAFLGQPENRPRNGSGWLGGRSVLFCEKFAAGVAAETLRCLNRVEFCVAATARGAVEILTLLPVEAIGYVFGD